MQENGFGVFRYEMIERTGGEKMYCVTIRWKALIASIVLSMGTGALAGLLTRDNSALYE